MGGKYYAFSKGLDNQMMGPFNSVTETERAIRDDVLDSVPMSCLDEGRNEDACEEYQVFQEVRRILPVPVASMKIALKTVQE